MALLPDEERGQGDPFGTPGLRLPRPGPRVLTSVTCVPARLRVNSRSSTKLLRPKPRALVSATRVKSRWRAQLFSSARPPRP